MIKEVVVNNDNKYQVIDITDKVREVIKESKIKEGSVIIYVMHATAAIIINENYDPNIGKDIIDALNNLIPEGKWLHDKVDNNGAAHIKAAILGPSEMIPIQKGEMQLGTWQSICLIDLDGPRKRKIVIQIK